MTTTAETLESLNSGEAFLRYIIEDEAWYHGPGRRRDSWVTSEVWVGIDAVGGGTYGEWNVLLCDLDGPTARHEIFQDGLAALAAVPGYWPAMAEALTQEDVVEALQSLGFRDTTPRVSPYKEVTA